MGHRSGRISRRRDGLEFGQETRPYIISALFYIQFGHDPEPHMVDYPQSAPQYGDVSPHLLKVPREYDNLTFY